jgi:hypothetical protein
MSCSTRIVSRLVESLASTSSGSERRPLISILARISAPSIIASTAVSWGVPLSPSIIITSSFCLGTVNKKTTPFWPALVVVPFPLPSRELIGPARRDQRPWMPTRLRLPRQRVVVPHSCSGLPYPTLPSTVPVRAERQTRSAASIAMILPCRAPWFLQCAVARSGVWMRVVGRSNGIVVFFMVLVGPGSANGQVSLRCFG